MRNFAPIFVHRQPAGESFSAHYNVVPQQGNPERYIPIIRDQEDGTAEAVKVQWWLLPFWSKEPRVKYSTFNARVETVAKAASFRDPFKRRRCLIPAAGWYEWQETPTGKQPWYIHSANSEVSMLAGLWDRWEKDGPIATCGSADVNFMFTATVELADHADGTRYTATVIHADEAGCKKHETMGFEGGWGAALDQLVAMLKKGTGI